MKPLPVIGAVPDDRCCKGFLDACRCWVVPPLRTAGVQESSREETAGRLGSLALRSMGIVALADVAVSHVGASDLWGQVAVAVGEDGQGCCFGCRDAGLVLEMVC